jgi:hypothetical protein
VNTVYNKEGDGMETSRVRVEQHWKNEVVKDGKLLSEWQIFVCLASRTIKKNYAIDRIHSSLLVNENEFLLDDGTMRAESECG